MRCTRINPAADADRGYRPSGPPTSAPAGRCASPSARRRHRDLPRLSGSDGGRGIPHDPRGLRRDQRICLRPVRCAHRAVDREAVGRRRTGIALWPQAGGPMSDHWKDVRTFDLTVYGDGYAESDYYQSIDGIGPSGIRGDYAWVHEVDAARAREQEAAQSAEDTLELLNEQSAARAELEDICRSLRAREAKLREALEVVAKAPFYGRAVPPRDAYVLERDFFGAVSAARAEGEDTRG